MPVATVLGVWRQNLSRFTEEAQRVVNRNRDWPLLIKTCHISMGHYKSTKPIFGKGDFAKSQKWYSDLHALKAHDYTRSWGRTFDLLSTSIEPGFMLQRRFEDAPKFRGAPCELKIEVLWGRAYLAAINTGAPGKCSTTGAIILRDGSITKYEGPFWYAQEEPCQRWIVDGGHMAYAWNLAEAVATLAEASNENRTRTRHDASRHTARAASPHRSRGPPASTLTP